MRLISIIVILGTLIINQVSGQNMINLAGEWNIKLDPTDIGVKDAWFETGDFANIVRLPGCIQEQGYGNIPNMETVWWKKETLHKWFEGSHWLKDYEKEDNFKTQAWLIPDRHYIGAVWFSREIEIPEHWNGNYNTLFLERCHWESKLWIDGNYYGSNLSLATPHIYDLSKLNSGKHTIVLRIDNSEKINLGRMAHSVSEQTAGTWNGIIGKIELESRTPVWLDNVQVYPDIDKKEVLIKGEIGRLKLNTCGSWEIEVEVKAYNFEGTEQTKKMSFSGIFPDSEKADFTFIYPMGENVKLWDEFNPNLYQLKLKLVSDVDNQSYIDREEVRCGMRKFEVRGRQFAINNLLTFLRGNTDCAVWPKSGYAPMDVDSWKKIWKAYKDFGLNMARFHSWCPPEAAFLAADEMGIYLAPEVGEWSYVNSQSQFDFLGQEARNILNAYGNYSSFIQMGLGNESSGNKKFFDGLIKEWKETDARHLYSIKANSSGNPENIDYEVVRAVVKDSLSKLRYQCGWPPKPLNSEFHLRAPQTAIDWYEGVMRCDYPLVQHETAQICAYPDIINEIRKYNGYLNPSYLEIAQEQLKERGLFEQLPDFVDASGKWQVELTREEFEAAYRTKELAGFHWLCLADFTGQNTAPVGFTDAFYDAKSYVDATKVRRWNGPTVLLARMNKRVLTGKDRFNAKIEVTHYGKRQLMLDDLSAKLKTSSGDILKEWKFEKKEFGQGSAWHISDISHVLTDRTTPEKLILELKSEKNSLTNEWNIWWFPEIAIEKFPQGIIVTNTLTESIEKKLERGKTVLLLPQIGMLKGNLPICFTNHYWTSFGENDGQSSASGVLINDDHPLFENFPTDNHTNWQWWDLFIKCQPMILDSYNTSNPWPQKYKPIIQPIDSWKINRKLALVAEGKVGKGKLLICSIDLETGLEDRPAARQFRKSLIDYMLSESFEPSEVLEIEMIKELFHHEGGKYNNEEEDINLPNEG